MKVEDMKTVEELREFADHANITIPAGKKTFQGILGHLKNPKSSPKSTDPAAEALAAQKAKEQGQRDLQVKTRAEKLKKALKKPLSEREKVYLSELEVLARSGHQPDTDQMKDLALLRKRAEITRLSVVEQNEMAELEVKSQAGTVAPAPLSGVTEKERLEQLRGRSEIE